MTLPLTYADLVCDSDLDPFGAETTSDLANLVQDVTHILVELPGSNPDDPLRGVGIELYLNGTQANLLALPGIIEGQLNQDDRIDQCEAKVLQQTNGDYLVTVTVAVSGSVLTLEFDWNSSAGLTLANGA